MRTFAFLFLWPFFSAAALAETPYLKDDVEAGNLPVLAERLPDTPAVDEMTGPGLSPGKSGGKIEILMAKAKDVRQMVVYGYSRLIGYDSKLRLQADILEKYEVEEGRRFTLHLRKGHKWSDGHPFTTEDFRYWWEDMATNNGLSPSGPPIQMVVDGKPPVVEYLDAQTVRYTWETPNPAFIPALAGARPLHIYAPAHYLKQFHERYQEKDVMDKMVADSKRRNWASLHNRMDNQYKNDNPNLPTLAPWVNTTDAPAERFIFKRNPFYHRVDSNGAQLPYLDEIIMNIVSSKLIPAKAGGGETDLQGRYLRFSDISFLKQNEEQYGFKTLLWRTGKGAHIALYPNMNHEDEAWRTLFRDARFRRALSLAINRHEINQVLYYGFAQESANTVLPDSPLYDDKRDKRWSQFDMKRANKLMDEIGLERASNGVRLLPNGQPLEIIIESAGESTEETDVLELIRKTWGEIGVKLFTKPLQREVLRNRVFSGQTQMAIWFGLENGLATPEMSPRELAPTSQQQLHWPRWGQYWETKGQAGAPVDMEIPKRLFALFQQWQVATSDEERRGYWEEMLDLWTDEVYTIGVISGVLQPIVATKKLQNVPTDGFYNWDPGAHFGIFRPDRFWLSKK